MTVSPVPTKVTKNEVDGVCGLDPTGPVCARLKEQREEWEKWERQRDAEEAKIRAAREQRHIEEAQAQADAQEAERVTAQEALEERLRGRFFTANPTAAEADWQRLKPRVLDEHFLAQLSQGDPEVAALAAKYGGYRI